MSAHPEYEGYRTLRFERRGDVLEITIDNPGSDMNVIDGTVHAELARVIRELRRERLARAVLLTGSKRAFSAGGDFAWFPTLDRSRCSTTCARTPTSSSGTWSTSSCPSWPG